MPLVGIHTINQTTRQVVYPQNWHGGILSYFGCKPRLTTNPHRSAGYLLLPYFLCDFSVFGFIVVPLAQNLIIIQLLGMLKAESFTGLPFLLIVHEKHPRFLTKFGAKYIKLNIVVVGSFFLSWPIGVFKYFIVNHNNDLNPSEFFMQLFL